MARSRAKPKRAPLAEAGPGRSAGLHGPADDRILRNSLRLTSRRTALSQAALGESPRRAAGVGWNGLPPQVLEPPTPRDPSEHPPADAGVNVLSSLPQVQVKVPRRGSGSSSLLLTARSLKSEVRAANRLRCSKK